MKFTISDEFSLDEVRVGNVYPVRGGRAARYAIGMVVIALSGPKDRHSDEMCHMLTISKEGEIVGATTYATHAMENRAPIGFVDGLDALDFDVRPI